MKSIAFAGHFDVFEKPTETQQRTIDDSLKTELAILVGDIGVAEKLAAYIKGGVEEVKDNYRFRKEDCSSNCVLSQLPSEEELDEIIDKTQYEKAIEILKQQNKTIYNKLKETEVEGLGELRTEYSRIVREHITPELVNNRLTSYGITDVKLYSERQMRNIVTRRTMNRSKPRFKKKSWRQIDSFIETGKQVRLGPMEIVNERGNPVCRGIMLALYETLTTQGYEKITQLYPTEHHGALTKAQVLFETVKEQLPQTKGKEVQFEYRWYNA